MKKTLVIGASTTSTRYAHQAVKRLVKAGIEAIALGKNPGKIGDIEIETQYRDFENIHTVSIYIREELQDTLFKYFKRLQPQRVIFNPGAENAILKSQLEKNGIECLNACTLVMLSTGSF